MSVLPLKADIHRRGLHVRLVPIADIAACSCVRCLARADGSMSLTLMRGCEFIVAYDTTKPTHITIAASAKPTTAEVHMLSS